MTFTSLTFYLFLPVVYVIFYFAPDRWRWLVLLCASYGFYASFKSPYLLAVLLIVTCISYACGLRIASQQDEVNRKRWLQIGVVSCIVILAFLKYLPFWVAQSNNIFGLSNTLSKSIIIIGVSYFTFQAISYLADIYLEIEDPEQHIGHFALYLSFFPKLLQGPIERAGDLLPQLNKPYQFDYDEMRSGLLLFTWGLFKKVVVADRFALFADQVFNNVQHYSGLPLIIGTYAYAFQIFFDFSAYTDMARGVGRIFGINLTENFNSPYLSTSISEFWRRWHISFSRWILDYIFKPLQFGWRNWGQSGTVVALLVTFFISGAWHGATWGYVIWGVMHGIYLGASTLYKPYQKKLHKWLGIEKSNILKWWQVFVTFNLTCVAWIFFRSNNVYDAITMLINILKTPIYLTNISSVKSMFENDILLKQSSREFYVLLLLIILFIAQTIYYKKLNIKYILNKSIFYRWSIYSLLIISLITLSVLGNTGFIYYNF